MKLIICLACLALNLAFDSMAYGQDVSWQKIANGIWKAEFGDITKQLRYTEFAAHEAQYDKLNQLQTSNLSDVLKTVRFGRTHDGKVYFKLSCQPDEKVYGFGLQFDGINKTQKILTLKVDHFSEGGGATHAPVPFFISSRGYGLLVNSARIVKFYNMVGNRKNSDTPPEVDRNPVPGAKQPGPWQAQPRSDSLEAYVHGEGLELIAFCGSSPMEIVQRYNLFCGGGTLPPLWALGFWHRVPAKFDSKEIRQEVAQFEEHKMPLDVVGLEPGWQSKSYPCTFEWQTKRFPDPKRFVNGLLNKGIRVNLWENPYISKDAAIYNSMHPLSGSHLVWLGLVPDYTLPKAREILIAQHKKEHFDIGVSGYKVDEVDGYDNWLWPDHATFPSRTSAETMRQTYGLQMQKMLYQHLFIKENKRTFGLVRASNGCASGYPFAIYSDSYGHRQYINGISSASLCGVLWCPEIRSASNSQEWINRIHTVCFSPLAMLNAWASGTKPWSFPDKTEAVRNTIELRLKLIPYLYSAYADYAFKGIPPIRSLLLESFGNTTIEDTSMFMFGNEILVAPFVDSSVERTIQLPPVDWFDFHTGEFVGNGTKIIWHNDNRAPIFVRDGALIPIVSDSIQNTRQVNGKDLEVRLYGRPHKRSFKIYEDDGISFDYRKGNYQYRQFALKKVDGKWKLVATNQDRNFDLYGKVHLKLMTSAR